MPVLTLIQERKKDKGYKITISGGLLAKLPKKLKKQFNHSKYVIITDTTVRRLLGKKLLTDLRAANIDAELFSFKPSEESKTLKTVETLLNKMFKARCDRGTCVIALGGGIVGDIAGFVASTYMRGIDVIQVPTTLLAMTDAAIGGKTGVNSKFGKNLIGAFHQPKAVFMDTEVLKSLPDEEIRNGYAEVIKSAAIRSKQFFKFLERNNEKILARKPRILKKIITETARIKADIVAKDAKEGHIRMILNYGHTYGHAVEKALKFRIQHGYAVSIGMEIINKMAVKEGLMNKKHAARITALLKRSSLPTRLPKGIKMSQLEKLLLLDKKRVNGKQNIIIVPRIGTAAIVEL
ncbi:3-dehydroquinate synthase [Candidatus Peregrinibacteria bacterium]|jgi:3-dehydroquinate synthase|nr:3-dehydroquinate synthase [Candidatus Peregrinibacteria bacterium]